MKTKIYRVLVLLLVASMTLGMLNGCRKEDNEQPIPTVDNNHIDNSVITDGYIVENRKSLYKILTREEPSKYELSAAILLQDYLGYATEATVEIVSTVQAGEQYISVGKTDAFLTNVPQEDNSELGFRGFKIKSIDNNIYVYSYSDMGVYMGASWLLSKLVNYECFGKDSIYYDKTANISNYNFDITEIPDFNINIDMSGYMRYDSSLRDNLGYTSQSVFRSTNGGAGFHNSMIMISPDEYAAQHPEFFSLAGDQLCYTARGNEEKLALMRNVVLECFKQVLLENPINEYTLIGFTIADNVNACTCAGCIESNRKYGCASASLIRFLNPIVEELYNWFETPDGSAYKREVDIMIFAYHSFMAPPVVRNEQTGAYEPVDETCVLNEHIVPMIAPINSEFIYSLRDDHNMEDRENIYKWSAICDQFMLWSYACNFSNFLEPFNWMNHVSDTVQLVSELNCSGLLIQQQYISKYGNFNSYMDYLLKRMSWNVDVNQEEVLNDFFEGYFGPAKDDMLNMYYGLRTQFYYQENVLGIYGDIFSKDVNGEAWSQDYLLDMISLGESAMQKIADLKQTDPDAYDAYSSHIKMETLMFRYLLIEIHGARYTEAELSQMKQAFRADCENLGVIYASEHAAITSLYNHWDMES